MSKFKTVDRAEKGEKGEKGEKVEKVDDVYDISSPFKDTVQELVSQIGVTKAQFYSIESDSKFSTLNSVKMFHYAFLTRIQEVLITISKNSGKSVKNHHRVDEVAIEELKNNVQKMNVIVPDRPIIPGTTVLEAQLMVVKSLSERALRQYVSIKNLNKGIQPEETVKRYLTSIVSYFESLAIHSLKVQSRDPLVSN